MQTGLYHAHSGLRYLVLVAALAAIAVLALGLFSRRATTRPARITTAIFNGLLDLQVLLGIALVAMGRFYPSLMGHITMMLLAAVAAHGFAVVARKQADPRRAHSLGLIGVVLALALIVFGILAIRDSPFESRAFGVTAGETR